MRVGVEVGGTFTDLVAVEGGKLVVTKVPSTPRSPDVGAFAALTASGIDLSRIDKAFFDVNGWVSLGFLALVALDRVVGG